ncbi:MAG: hypothetical protein KDC64_03000 [Aequorivita sp.]|nr:hypothetical protein [Aequorivita sp.]
MPTANNNAIKAATPPRRIHNGITLRSFFPFFSSARIFSQTCGEGVASRFLSPSLKKLSMFFFFFILALL